MKNNYDIEPVQEDMIRVDVAKMLKVNDSTLSKVTSRYNLGYRRAGAGNYLFLTSKDIQVLKEYFKMTKRHKTELLNFYKNNYVQ